jgi:hypothetical protein
MAQVEVIGSSMTLIVVAVAELVEWHFASLRSMASTNKHLAQINKSPRRKPSDDSARSYGVGCGACPTDRRSPPDAIFLITDFRKAGTGRSCGINPSGNF